MLEGKRVLVIDTELDSPCACRERLVECGADVVTASCAEDAISRLDEREFDVIITEVRLPQMNGYELCKWLARSRHSRLPVVAASVNPFVNEMNIVRCPNVVDFLRKPYTTTELVDALRRLFAGEPSLLAAMIMRRPCN